MPADRLARLALLDDLELSAVRKKSAYTEFEVRKVSEFEVCPKCANKCSGTYDKRWSLIKDAPIRGKRIVLKILKRRIWCKTCKKPFTEPVSGISKGHRTTQRFRRHVLWACEHFTDLKSVRRHAGCSYSSLYRIYYEQLELQLRKRIYPWPKVIGIDEHKFKKHPDGGWPIFATNIVDHRNKRVYELVEGRSVPELKASHISTIPGRENVSVVTMDLSSPYRRFVKDFFPNARIVADKFHVVRLLHPAINRQRINITGDKRKNPARKLFLKNGKDLDFFTRSAIYKFLEYYPELKEIYHAKEAIHGFYRIRGYNRARKALNRILDRFGRSKLPEILTLRTTLLSWSKEILEYFRTGLTNGRTEGFNGKAKLIKRRAYGYRSFKNYRLRVLNACA